MVHLALIMLGAAVAAAPAPEVELPTSLDLEAIRALPVQHDGRWPPLDTVARDIVGEKVTGDMFYRGRDPVLWLLAWTFAPEKWREQPLIPIRNAELRGELKLPAAQTVFSYAELVSHPHLRTLSQALAHREKDGKPDPLESKVSDINEQLNWLHKVFSGEAIRIIPDRENLFGAWRPVSDPMTDTAGEAKAVAAAWAAVGEAFLADDGQAFAAASARLVAAAEALPAAYRPGGKLIATELRYNQLRPFRLAWVVMGVGALLSTAAMFVRRKWFDAIAVVGLIAGFAVVTYGLSLRWQIAGRIPAANMFESLLFLGWGMGAFAIVATMVFHHRIVPLTASAMGAVALALADCLPLDPFVRPIVPVLRDTVWMSIHVPVIMVSYSVLALGVLFAHVQLVVLAVLPRRRQLGGLIDSLHYWYIHVGSILLLAGIITGSMWAASSWGRYWGWDPKEVWSLIAFLGYLAILHVRIDHGRVPPWGYPVGLLLVVALFVLVVPKLGPLTAAKAVAFSGTGLAMLLLVIARGQFATALKSILCFWLIIMTYVGVNYILGIGLHTYGFGTGAMARWMLLLGGLDLLFAVVLGVLYLAWGSTRAREPHGKPAIAAA